MSEKISLDSSGTNKYAEAIRNSGTAGRTNPLIKHTLQRPASEGNEKE